MQQSTPLHFITEWGPALGVSKLALLQLERNSANKMRFMAPLAAAGGMQSQNVSYPGYFPHL